MRSWTCFVKLPALCLDCSDSRLWIEVFLVAVWSSHLNSFSRYWAFIVLSFTTRLALVMKEWLSKMDLACFLFNCHFSSKQWEVCSSLMVQTTSGVVLFVDLIADRIQVTSLRIVSESSMCWASQRFYFFLAVLTIADFTALSIQTVLTLSRSIAKTLCINCINWSNVRSTQPFNLFWFFVYNMLRWY